MTVKPAGADVLLANNSPSSSADCISFLRTSLAAAGEVHYVDRATDFSALQPSVAATLRLWGPEEDTASYYQSFAALAANLRVADAATVADAAALADPSGGGGAGGNDNVDVSKPLAGIDAGAFFNLVDIRRTNAASTLLEIDKAANNTSVVMALEWNGWRLLFPGDAEQLAGRRWTRRASSSRSIS
jgi:hypothetical protein